MALVERKQLCAGATGAGQVLVVGQEGGEWDLIACLPVQPLSSVVVVQNNDQDPEVPMVKLHITLIDWCRDTYGWPIAAPALLPGI